MCSMWLLTRGKEKHILIPISLVLTVPGTRNLFQSIFFLAGWINPKLKLGLHLDFESPEPIYLLLSQLELYFLLLTTIRFLTDKREIRV